MKKIISLAIISLFLMSINIASAHQPKLINNDAIFVKNPEVSQAFYAELKGNSHLYTIESETSFKLYVGLLVPDIHGVEKDFSALISKEENDDFEVLLDGNTHEWTPYYEEHAGDDYFTGPALQAEDSDPALHPKGLEVEAGKYTIKVFSPDNLGKYVLVVGDQESFPLKEIVKTIIEIPKIKSYFNKSPFSAFSTPTTIGFLLITILSFTAIIGIALWLIRRFYKN